MTSWNLANWRNALQPYAVVVNKPSLVLYTGGICWAMNLRPIHTAMVNKKPFGNSKKEMIYLGLNFWVSTEAALDIIKFAWSLLYPSRQKSCPMRIWSWHGKCEKYYPKKRSDR